MEVVGVDLVAVRAVEVEGVDALLGGHACGVDWGNIGETGSLGSDESHRLINGVTTVAADTLHLPDRYKSIPDLYHPHRDHKCFSKFEPYRIGLAHHSAPVSHIHLLIYSPQICHLLVEYKRPAPIQ